MGKRDFAQNSLQMGTPYSDRFALQCEGTIAQTELIKQLKNEKFDVMIAENFDMCGIGECVTLKQPILIIVYLSIRFVPSNQAKIADQWGGISAARLDVRRVRPSEIVELQSQLVRADLQEKKLNP